MLNCNLNLLFILNCKNLIDMLNASTEFNVKLQFEFAFYLEIQKLNRHVEHVEHDERFN